MAPDGHLEKSNVGGAGRAEHLLYVPKECLGASLCIGLPIVEGTYCRVERGAVKIATKVLRWWRVPGRSKRVSALLGTRVQRFSGDGQGGALCCLYKWRRW